MSRRTRFWKKARDGAFAVLGFGTLALALFFLIRDPQERAVQLRLTGGQAAGERHRVAIALKQAAAGRKLAITLSETTGSAESIQDVDSGRLDAALIQGALYLGDRPNLRQVASLHVEPLHLLVKEEIFPEIETKLSALKGKSIGLGEEGSGTSRLATEFLEFAGLKAPSAQRPGDYRSDRSSYTKLLEEKNRDKLPDAVFMVSTLPSPVARHLVLEHRYRLVPLPFIEAFTIGSSSPATDERESISSIDRRFIQSASIPAFTYEVEPPVPPEAIPTIGTRLLIISHKDTPSNTIVRLLDVIYSSHFSQLMRPPLEAKLLELPPEIPWHDGTLAYLQRNAPIIAGDVVDLIEKELSILGALAGSLFFLGQWLRRRFRRLRDRGFESYILRVNLIERRAIVLERSSCIELASLLKLQEELSNLKGEALEKFVDGELDGEQLMSGFLTHVADTREFLTRLILHERAHQHSPPEVAHSLEIQEATPS